MFLLCVFAVSNVVTANGATLFRIPLPQKIQELASIFRASGRMFWPTYYLLFLWAVVTLSRFRKKEWLPSLVIGVLCLVQLVDISPALIGRHTQMAQYQEQNPTAQELETYGDPDYTVVAAPGFKCDPVVDGVHSEAAIMIDYEAHLIVICGSQYAGEIKKSVFSTMNYVLTKEGILPMHCSANMDPVTHETAVFFGLSGTGKTTLSADPNRKLIGDDEHGWSADGVFNIEGGCYAKCINLSAENEPDIYNAIRFGALVENVVMDPDTRELDFDDASLTENTRVGYPVTYINNAAVPGVGGVPKVVIFLTADAFGVLPPISKLTPDAAMYHFVTGFTSKLAGTERGITEPKPTFSTLFGEPFMPMDPSVYANMLGQKIQQYGTSVYLVNTGWAGGSAQELGKAGRMKLSYTRAMVTAALNGELANAEYEHSDIFNVEMPKAVTGVPAEILNPETMWIANGKTKEDYVVAANRLATMFAENFAKKYPNMPKNIAEAGPKAI